MVSGAVVTAATAVATAAAVVTGPAVGAKKEKKCGSI